MLIISGGACVVSVEGVWEAPVTTTPAVITGAKETMTSCSLWLAGGTGWQKPRVSSTCTLQKVREPTVNLPQQGCGHCTDVMRLDLREIIQAFQEGLMVERINCLMKCEMAALDIGRDLSFSDTNKRAGTIWLDVWRR